LLALIPLLALLALGCEGRKPEAAGFGRWRFNHLTLDQVKEGKCQPTDLNDGRKATWCFAQTPYKVGKRTAEVNAYFLGTAPDSKLIEVQLSVRGCVEDDLEQFLRQSYGPPIEVKGNRASWKNSFIWIAAIMPSDPGRCLVHMLPVSENGEIARIKAAGDTPAQ
jgi:hypothetical protein